MISNKINGPSPRRSRPPQMNDQTIESAALMQKGYGSRMNDAADTIGRTFMSAEKTRPKRPQSAAKVGSQLSSA